MTEPTKPCNYPPPFQDCDGCPEGLRCQGWDECEQAYAGYIRLPSVEEIKQAREAFILVTAIKFQNGEEPSDFDEYFHNWLKGR